MYITTRTECTEKDGTVRQHDLRAPTHQCGAEGATCSTQLVKLSHRLFSMSIAPSTPHQLVVAGDHPYVCFILLPKTVFLAYPTQGYLFDRRQIGRLLQAEWGVPVEDSSLTSCVRRFSTKAKPSPEDYITAARVSSSNGHEVRRRYRVITTTCHNGVIRLSYVSVYEVLPSVGLMFTECASVRWSLGLLVLHPG